MPVRRGDPAHSPLGAYRWEHTDPAPAAQVELAAAGYGGAVEPGHAAVRFSDPTTGRDALVTLRTEMHRLRVGAGTQERRVVGSSVWQVFTGEGVAHLGGQRVDLAAGDLIA